MDRPLPDEPLAVDLLNTRWVTGAQTCDLLATNPSTAAWLEGHGLEVSRRVLPAARANLIEAREALAAAIAGGVGATVGINRVLDRGRVRLQLAEDGPVERIEVEDPAWHPAWACVREYLALREQAPGRIRKCAADDCVLHFVDVSRGGDRRWCSMAACGNRSKVRRHRIEARQPGSSSPEMSARTKPPRPLTAVRHPVTPDGRYFVVRGRLWRCSDPSLPPEERERLTRELMAARRAKQTALRVGDDAAREEARAAVDAAKRELGERGPVWWNDGAPDFNRRMAKHTPYAEWYRDLDLHED